MGCFPGYLSLGGTELVNSARTTAYMRNGLAPPTMQVDDCGCPDLSLALCDGDEYRLPGLDDAPWFDPARPESAEFAGLFVEEIEGLDGSPYERQVFDRIGDGGVFGRGRMRPREITVRGWLFGADCCSIAYGLDWLASALEGNRCKSGCRGDELWFFTCCPTICDETITGMTDEDDDGIVETPMPDRSGADPDIDGEPACANFNPTAPNCCGQGDEDYESCAARACVDPFLRNMQDVALVEGPRVLERWAGGNCSKSCACAGCRGVRVEFTLVAATPWKYGLTEVISECTTWDLSDDGECVMPFVEKDEDGNCPDPCAERSLDCVVDPDCPIPAPPVMPTVANPCICLPVSTARQCVAIEPSEFGVWKEVVPYIEISSGSQPMRNVVVRFYQNGAGFDCSDPDRFPDCGACATIAISYIPEGATMRIDGTSRTALVECAGGEVADGLANLYDADGGAFSWPVFDCAGVCVCVDVDRDDTATDACLSVGAAVRESA